MSSFKCNICGVENIDSLDDDGTYTSGCCHYPPKKDGDYMVEELDYQHAKIVTRLAIFRSGSWVDQYNEVVEWWKE